MEHIKNRAIQPNEPETNQVLMSHPTLIVDDYNENEAIINSFLETYANINSEKHLMAVAYHNFSGTRKYRSRYLSHIQKTIELLTPLFLTPEEKAYLLIGAILYSKQLMNDEIKNPKILKPLTKICDKLLDELSGIVEVPANPGQAIFDYNNFIKDNK